MNTTEFFAQHGHLLTAVHHDDPETGDYRLMCPEESEKAIRYLSNSFTIASIYEDAEGAESVLIDNDPTESPNKVGWFVLETL
jgi:hypothetical protein